MPRVRVSRAKVKKPRAKIPKREPKQVPTPMPTAAQRIERRRQVRTLLIMGGSRDEILDECARSFGMSEEAVDALIADVRQDMRDRLNACLGEDGRAIQLARLTDYKPQLVREKKWAAVAQIEKLEMDLLGTAAAKKLNVTVDGEVREVVAHVLSELSAEQLAALVRGEDIPLGGHSRPELPGKGGDLDDE